MIDLNSPEVHGMRAQNFKRMTEGYHGTLARHGETIVITIPFETEVVAKNAENWIVGDGDRAGGSNISPIDEIQKIIRNRYIPDDTKLHLVEEILEEVEL